MGDTAKSVVTAPFNWAGDITEKVGLPRWTGQAALGAGLAYGASGLLGAAGSATTNAAGVGIQGMEQLPAWAATEAGIQGAAGATGGALAGAKTYASMLPSLGTAGKLGLGLAGMSALTGMGARSSEDQARELYASRFPNQSAIESSRTMNAANANQALLLAQRDMDERLASRGMRGGFVGGQQSNLAREAMKLRGQNDLALTQFANTPNSQGITPWKTQEQQMAELLASAAGTAGGVYAYKNLFA